MAFSTDPIIDWAAFTNDRPHTLVRGRDFHRDPELVRKAAGMWAKRHGYRAATSIVSGRLTIQFIPREAANV